MPDTLAIKATTRLFSWMRQGLHAGLAAARTDVSDGHLAVPMRVRVNNSRDVDVPVKLYGPGDVTGIDPREVIRTDPHHLLGDFEPNYFPLIEFDRPDFPWLFTPEAPDASGRLQPWICLVVVPTAAALITTAPNLPLPVFECFPSELPNLNEAWAWAHAQIVEGTTPVMDPALDPAAQKKALSETLRKYPERTLSRLLGPRRLDSNTDYVACVVPTFDVGRKTGLGETVSEEDERALSPAWTAGSPNSDHVRLPVYYYWEFRTSSEGDFEALARRLEKRKLSPSLGLRAMSIAAAGWGMPELPPDTPGTVLGLEGALTTPDTESTPWPEPARSSFQSSLRKILNAPAELAPADGQTYLVGPPLYGQWHAKQRTVRDDDKPPNWFREMNSDPRSRVAAGLGALVIRNEQEQLMASAWEQLAQHEQDNQRLKRAQLAEAVGEVLSEKHIQPLPIGSLMQFTAPVRSAVAKTRQLAASSQLVPMSAMTSAAFRRIARPRGPIARRVRSDSANLKESHAVKAMLLKELEPRVAETGTTDLVQFAPEFPQPMYEPLRDYFQDALLPGIEQVPPNTISLLETNPRFIEAYMVGLNHEMGRELLWRGFPTDQRGTYFRQFWDVLGRVPVPTPDEREGLKDILPITTWSDAAHLGENAGKTSAAGQMVLLIRGDLLHRYPRAIIYAAEAVWSADGARRELGTEERYPIFRAAREPDITMLGFPLNEEQVRGAETRAAGPPGWFFVLQEQPTEPRFGLDTAVTFGSVPEHWSDLSWGNLAADEDAFKELVYIPLDGPLKDKTLDNVRWGDNAGQMAFITRQRPFRVAIHARVWLSGA